ncbi:transcriptional regulator Crp/Fnr family [Paramagnetospirillum magnetotacticum MS-1]|uniref:Transcriptional regulator Crp/Fnr family n=1 Tax=Paramagnetospirillum magnetotacticum MS-1 TaxID=272627 RepID=A0A0C2YZU6_PARME|nr:transcriptional regulator Crp/Fnr family [Paramagnetospirillum magnetotacticum MS-1]
MPFAQGQVYSGLDPFADRAVRIYEISAGQAGFRPGSLVEDVREGGRASHPNLLPALLDMASKSGPSFLVTSSVKGVRLDSMAADTGLTEQGALHIARVLGNVMVYCWKSGLKGLGFGPKSVVVAQEGIRVASIAESRLLARAEGRAIEDTASDIAAYSQVLDCMVELCRRAGGKAVTLETAALAIKNMGIGAARQIINGPLEEAVDDGSGAARLTLDSGDFIFKESDSSDDTFYVLEKGLVQVVKADGLGNEMFLDFTRPGQLIGEMAVIDKLPRMASARVLEPSRLLVIRGENFRTRLGKLDKVALMLIETLSGRLRQRADEVTKLKAALGGNR